MIKVRKSGEKLWQEVDSIEEWGETNACSVGDIVDIKKSKKVSKFKITNISYKKDKDDVYVFDDSKGKIDKKSRPLVYLAIPYSHPNKKIMLARFKLANEVASDLMKEGHCVYSPITHNHPISLGHDLPGSWDFWKKFDLTFLGLSHKLIVIKADGWKESVGVQAEIEFAEKDGLEIEYLDV